MRPKEAFEYHGFMGEGMFEGTKLMGLKDWNEGDMLYECGKG